MKFPEAKIASRERFHRSQQAIIPLLQKQYPQTTALATGQVTDGGKQLGINLFDKRLAASNGEE